MSWNLVALEDVAPQPWRNGGGITRELLAWPDAAHWQARLSVADVAAPGPFSRYPGIERWFAVLEGAGVELRVAGETHRATRSSEPLRFDGGADAACALLDGATRDFNLMAAPGTAILRRVRGSVPLQTRSPGLLAVYAHHASAQLVLDGDALHVPAMHLAWCWRSAPAAGTLSAEDALWMEAGT